MFAYDYKNMGKHEKSYSRSLTWPPGERRGEEVTEGGLGDKHNKEKWHWNVTFMHLDKIVL